MSSFVNKHILIVEDDLIIAVMGQRQLQEKGYQITHVTSGEEVVEFVFNTNVTIDLILMDIDLGHGMPGTEAAKIILEQKDIPILFLSSHTEPEVVQTTENITSYGYVVKGSGLTILDASIKMAFKLFEAKLKQKQKEIELFYSQEKFHKIFQTSPAAISITSLPDGIFLEVNKSFERIFGYTKEEVIGKTSLALNVWKYPEERERLMQIYLKDKIIENTKIELISKSGQTILGIVTFSMLELNGKFYSISVLSDFTNQKQAWLDWSNPYN